MLIHLIIKNIFEDFLKGGQVNSLLFPYALYFKISINFCCKCIGMASITVGESYQSPVELCHT